MKTSELMRTFRNSSLLDINTQKLYLLAQTTGEVDRIPATKEIIQYRDYEDKAGYEIVAMNDYFVAVNIWDFSDDEPECKFYIFENGILVTMSTNTPDDFGVEFRIVYGA